MNLSDARGAVAAIDEKIIALIRERQELASRIAEIKHREGKTVIDPEQKKTVLSRAFDAAVEAQVDPVEVREIFDILIRMNEERQREYSGEGNLP